MHTQQLWLERLCLLCGIAAQAAALCLAAASVTVTCARVVQTARRLSRQLP